MATRDRGVSVKLEEGPEIQERDLAQLSRALEIIATRVLGNVDEARDAVQETVARLVQAQRLGRVPGDAPLGVFAYGIHKHVLADVMRARSRAREGAVDLARFPAPDPTPLELLIRSEEREAVSRALARLSAPEREVLRRCFVDGEKLVEIARAKREPPERIRKRKSRALQHLREILSRTAFGSGHDPALSAIKKV